MYRHRNNKETELQRVITYSRALTQVLKAFDILESRANWVERLLIQLLRASYQQRLGYIVKLAPVYVSYEDFENRKKARG